jgi:serine/threonine-protein kinase
MDATILGKVLHGRTVGGEEQQFRVELYLGGGGFGDVYKAVRDHRLAALKITRRTYNDAADLEEMLAEALLLNELRACEPGGANLIEVYGFGVLEDYYRRGYVAMEYVAGGSLEGRLERLGRGRGLPAGEAVEILRQLCLALRLAHSQEPPILHRDIKPGNVLLGRDGSVKLSDWGLAARARAFSHSLGTAGDLRYEAPEGLCENLELPCSDIYGLGLVAYEMVTGYYPFPLSGLRGLEGRPAAEAHYYLRRGGFTPPLRLPGGCPAALDAIIVKALAFDRSLRYQSVEGLLADLETCSGLAAGSAEARWSG